MKRVLLIGKFNEFLRMLNKELSYYFSMQLCSDNLELLEGMLKMGKPDIILISASELKESHQELFRFLDTKYSHISVFCIGNKEELEFVNDFPASGRVRKIMRPVLIKDIAAAINGSLDIETPSNVPEHRKAEEGKAEKKTILLVDDTAVQLRAMENILKPDYNIKMATSGMAALEIVKKCTLDLILLDYDMPDCDGKETFERIRKEENGKTVPVVFVTGVNEKERIMAVLKLKPEGYLVKPVKRDALLDIVRQTLENCS